jgi:asparagine synthase (glutamine-hydrolysing)
MCGIFAVLGCADCSQAQRARVLACSRRLKHRGPDWSGVYQHEGNFLAQQRLAVVSPLSGDQPLFNEDRTVVVVVRDTNRSISSRAYGTTCHALRRPPHVCHDP